MASSSGALAKDGARHAHSATAVALEVEGYTAADSAASTPERVVGASRSARRPSLNHAPVHGSDQAAGAATAAGVPVGNNDGAASKVLFFALRWVSASVLSAL